MPEGRNPLRVGVLLAGTLAIAGLALAVACGGGSSGQPIERFANPTEQAAADEEAIGAVLDDWGKALSREDWSDVYDLLPPSARAECPRGRYLVTVDAELMLLRETISDEAWEALKDDGSDGIQVRSIVLRGDAAIADTLESGELELRHEEGRWWVDQDHPCEIGDD